MESILKEYASYLHQLGYAPSSIRGRHRIYVREFINFIKSKGVENWQAISVHHIKDYLNYLRARENKVIGGKLRAKTVYDHYRSIALLYDLLLAKEEVQSNPSSEIQVKCPPRNQRKITVTEIEIKQLYKHCKNAKERSILSLNYGCGLRVGELESLEIRDLQLEDQYLIVRKGKGNKRRIVPLSLGVIKDLKNYLQYERPRLKSERHYHSDNQSVLLNEVGRSMKEWTLNKTLQSIAKRTANSALINKRISTHVMRHSIATHLLERGLEIN